MQTINQPLPPPRPFELQNESPGPSENLKLHERRWGKKKEKFGFPAISGSSCFRQDIRLRPLRRRVSVIRRPGSNSRAPCPACLRQVLQSVLSFSLSSSPSLSLSLSLSLSPSATRMLCSSRESALSASPPPLSHSPFAPVPLRSQGWFALFLPCFRVYLFLYGGRPVASAPSSLATQTSINFAGSGPAVFQFRVSPVNAKHGPRYDEMVAAEDPAASMFTQASPPERPPPPRAT